MYTRMVIFGGLRSDGKTQVTIGCVPQVVDEIVEVVRLIPQERSATSRVHVQKGQMG